MKRSSWSNCCKETTTKGHQEETWAKTHKHWTLDRWKSVLWSDESKFEIFGYNRRVFVRRRVGERMISACGSHREARRKA